MIYYFAYGSNLDQKQMKSRCPSYKLIGKYVLKNYKLAYTIFSKKRNCGCADIIESVNDEVWGLLYQITKDDLEKLDLYEGHPVNYKRFTVRVQDINGKTIEAQSYEVVNKKTEYQIPSREYHRIIVDNSTKNGFPDSYHKFLLSFKTLSK